MLKIGIIGTGACARKLALMLQGRCPDALHAVASRSIDKAEAFAEEFGITRAYGSAEELIIDEVIDIVYIATPRLYYYDLAVLALEHGKPIAYDRSMVGSEAQADHLEQLAHEHGLDKMMSDLSSFFTTI